MVEINQKKTLRQKIKNQKEKQRKLHKTIRDEINKAEQLKISIEGIEKLSQESIRAIQDKREKSITKAKKSIIELAILIKQLKQSENRLQSSK